jgi:putative flippase GtrA
MSDENLAVAPESGESDTISVIGARSTHEFIRYFVASLIALVIDTGVLVVLTSIVGISYLISGAVAFMCGLAVTYMLSIWWVFERRHARAGFEFFVFFVIGLTGLLINELVLWALTGGLGVYYLFSKVASAGIVFLWNFFARKYVLFR